MKKNENEKEVLLISWGILMDLRRENNDGKTKRKWSKLLGNIRNDLDKELQEVNGGENYENNNIFIQGYDNSQLLESVPAETMQDAKDKLIVLLYDNFHKQWKKIKEKQEKQSEKLELAKNSYPEFRQKLSTYLIENETNSKMWLELRQKIICIEKFT